MSDVKPETETGQAVNPASALGRLETLDRRATLFLYTRARNPVFEALMPAMSIGANRGVVHILTGVAMLVFGGDRVRAAALVMLAASGAAGIVAELSIKIIWKRKRPFMVMPEIAARVPHRRLLKRPSFPSGHAAGYMASAATLSFFFPQWAALFMLIGALGAFSRVYNGVHFVSDVIFGSVVGIAFAALAMHFLAAPVLSMFNL